MAGAIGISRLQVRAVPQALGIILIVATVIYLADVVAAFLLPNLAEQIHIYLGIVPAIAEIWMVLYLLVVGVRSPRSTDRTPAVDAAPIPA
jgi:hypothetical protein